MTVLLLILGLLLFVALVVVHEYGHYIAARRNGVKVEEFAIGFPPRAWGKKLKSGMVLSVNWLPLGGFVRLNGEHDADTKKGSYGAASLKTKTKIMMAGVGMNLLTALVLLTVLALVGMPKLIEDQFTVARDTKVTANRVLVSFIEPGSPAEKSGLKERDQIKAIGTESSQQLVSSSEQLPQATKQYAGQEVTVQVVREGTPLTLEKVRLRSTEEVEASKKTDNPIGYYGISPTELSVRRSTWSAPIVALGVTKQFTVATLKGLGSAIKGLGSTIAGIFTGNTKARQEGQQQASSQVSGPIGIFIILKDGSSLGFQFMLMIIAIISLTLAIMNFLPIPALDGGRLFVTWLYRIMRKPLTQKTEDRIHGTGFAVLMLLFVLITIVDIKRFW